MNDCTCDFCTRRKKYESSTTTRSATMGSRDHSIECEVCGYYSGGLNNLLCECEVDDDTKTVLARYALDTLAANLAMGGACERARLLGYVLGVYQPNHSDSEEYKATHREMWRPGRGKAAP